MDRKIDETGRPQGKLSEVVKMDQYNVEMTVCWLIKNNSILITQCNLGADDQ